MRTARGAWIAFAVSVAVALGCGLLALGGLLSIRSDSLPVERRGDAIVAVIFAVCTLAAIGGAVYFEHQARRRMRTEPTADGSSALSAGRAQPIGASRGRGAHRHARRTAARRPIRQSPAALALMMIAMGGLTGLFAASSANVYHDNQVFQATKARGISRSAIVTDNTVESHNTRSGRSYTTTVTLALDQPVAGVASERISLSGQHIGADYQPGARAHLLVNPGDPHYALFADQSTSDDVFWIVLLCFAVVTGAVAIWATVVLVRFHQHKRARRT